MKIIEKLKKLAQSHLIEYYESLDKTEQENFENSLSDIDIEETLAMQEEARKNLKKKKTNISPAISKKATDKERENFYEIGFNFLKKNKAAVLILAGGMGSRLAHAGPKGSFKLQNNKSLFEIHMDRIKTLSKKLGENPEVFVMTSRLNHKETISFFESNNMFDYKGAVHFFMQGNVACFLENGEIILEAKDRIMLSPDGNGGVFRAFARDEIKEIVKAKSLEWIHIIGVDNVLAKPLDPEFVGFALSSKANISSKSVKRDYVDEKVGLFLLNQNRPAIFEYTEIPRELLEQKRADGSFLYNDANIVNHLFKIDELYKRVDDSLEFHRAHKKVDYFDIKSQKLLKAEKENAFKFEQFLFDIFPLYDEMPLYQVKREEEFAPLKNKTGKDSAETAYKAYTLQDEKLKG